MGNSGRCLKLEMVGVVGGEFIKKSGDTNAFIYLA